MAGGTRRPEDAAGSVAFYVLAAGFMLTLVLLFFGAADLLRLAAAHRHLEAGLEASLRGSARLFPFGGHFSGSQPYLRFDRQQTPQTFRALLARNLGLAEAGDGWEGELPHLSQVGHGPHCRNRLLDGPARYRLQVTAGPRSEMLVGEVWAPVQLPFVRQTVVLHVRREVLPQPVATTADGRSAGPTEVVSGAPLDQPDLRCG